MTSKPAPSKRQQLSTSTVPVVKPQCNIHSTALVADKVQITGAHIVEIGEDVIIHPHARIRAEHGNVIIGKGSIIAEKAIVGVAEGSGETDIVIGDGVSIESGAVVEAREVGDHSTVEINAKIGQSAVVGKWCKIAPLEEVRAKEILKDYTVVFGNGRRRADGVLKERKEVREMKCKARVLEMEALRGLMVDAKVRWTG